MSIREAITLHGLRFHTMIGVLPHEAVLPQPLEIDVTVRRTRGGGASQTVLDYRAVYDIVAGEIARGPAGYLEDVGHRIAAALMAMDGADSVRVAARKPHVTLPGPLAYAEVVVERDERA